ncbi:hypothetical protein [uncultured Fluviicola sp.]|uniref:hypothetical protein n=1 Tax=uncultured Fluviicola sp. TaxID=463303 RepID=UPI0025D963E4|nr:hypothetical protein [uncultured Fluviicola sp.]
MDTRSQSVRYGLYSFAGIVALFLLTKLFSLEHVTFLRFLNILIIIFFTNRLAKLNHKNNVDNNYLNAWVSLILANVITVSLSLIGFVIYAMFIEPDFISKFEGGILWNNHITLGQAALTLFTEGIGCAVAISFIIMQYWNESPKSKVSPTEKH